MKTKDKIIRALIAAGSAFALSVILFCDPHPAHAYIGGAWYRWVAAFDPTDPCWQSGYWTYTGGKQPFPITLPITTNFPAPVLQESVNDFDITLNPGCCHATPYQIGKVYLEQYNGTNWSPVVPPISQPINMPPNSTEVTFSFTVNSLSIGNTPGFPKIDTSCNPTEGQ